MTTIIWCVIACCYISGCQGYCAVRHGTASMAMIVPVFHLDHTQVLYCTCAVPEQRCICRLTCTCDLCVEECLEATLCQSFVANCIWEYASAFPSVSICKKRSCELKFSHAHHMSLAMPPGRAGLIVLPTGLYYKPATVLRCDYTCCGYCL